MTNEQETKRKGFFNLGKHWPFVIVLMLLAHASLMIGTIIHIGGKKDTYVDPDYYAKSVDWDNQREQLEAVEREGWVIDVRSEFIDQDPDQRRVEFDLFDASGEPITDAMVTMVCYHPAALNQRMDVVLLHDENGTYARTLPIDRTGIWVAELTIQRRGIRAQLTEDLDVYSVPTTATP